MSVFLRVDINIVAMVLLGEISFIAYKRLDRQDTLNKVFLRISLIIILQLFLETATCIINKRPEQWLIPISIVLHICLFIGSPILTYFWYLLVKNMVLPDGNSVSRNNFLFLLPVILVILLTVLSPIYKLVFFIDRSNVYHRGQFYLVVTAATYFYIVYGIGLIVINNKKIVKQNLVPLFISGVLPIVGGVVQTIYYGPLLMWSSTAFSLVIVYVFLQERMVHLDDLTGVWNRGSFDYHISKRIMKKGFDKFGIVYLDIDGLKEINDSYGHLEGDYALKVSVSLIKDIIKETDVIARMGGDEFIIILNSESNEDLKQTIEKIEESFSNFNKNSAKKYKLECSFGADIFSSNTYSSIEQFLHHIDTLMYENKKQKKNRA